MVAIGLSIEGCPILWLERSSRAKPKGLSIIDSPLLWLKRSNRAKLLRHYLKKFESSLDVYRLLG